MQHFTIVIPAYNVEKWVRKNVVSAVTQEYENFEVVYVNDCSTDKTGHVVSETLDYFGNPKNFTYVENSENRKALYNIYDAVRNSQEGSVIVTLDGDDWLSTSNVLSLLNDVYNTGDVWITAGSYIINSNGVISSPNIHNGFWNGNIRRHVWTISHLRTFRKELFMNIDKNDMLDHDGDFYKFTFDQAMMFPMVEMAGPEHFYPINDVLYVYNRGNPLSVDRIHRAEQLRIERDIRSKKPYKNLSSLV
jgi:glycosyltransferase involved in cell wall biosynthesis